MRLIVDIMHPGHARSSALRKTPQNSLQATSQKYGRLAVEQMVLEDTIQWHRDSASNKRKVGERELVELLLQQSNAEVRRLLLFFPATLLSARVDPLLRVEPRVGQHLAWQHAIPAHPKLADQIECQLLCILHGEYGY